MSNQKNQEQNQKNPDQPLIVLDKRQKFFLTIALLLGLTLILFFNSMVKAVGSNISSDLGDASLFGFMNTIFFLCSTSMMPVSVKIGDKYGRKPIIATGIVVYGASLLIAGLTHSMTIHLIARGGQGLGQGCLLANSLAFLGEINTKQDRSRALGWYSVITGVTNILGPITGGLVTDALGWRWTCTTAMPIAVICLVLVLVFMPKVIINGEVKIDIPGAVAIAASAIGIVMFISFGQTFGGYTSPFSLGMLALFLAGLIVTLMIERKAEAPCIDLALFKQKRFTITILAIIFLAPAMYATGSYIANYGQAVRGLSATVAGSFVSLNSVGLLGMGVVYTWLSVKTSIKNICLLDAALFIVNVVMMMTLGVHTALPFIIVTVLIQGMRTSIYMPAFTTSLQNDMPPEQTGIATSTAQFAQSLIGTVSVSLVSTILNNTFAKKVVTAIPEGLTEFVDPSELSGFLSSTWLMSNKAEELAAYRSSLPGDAQELFSLMIENVRTAYASGLQAAYTVILVCCCIGGVCCILMKIWEKKATEEKAA